MNLKPLVILTFVIIGAFQAGAQIEFDAASRLLRVTTDIKILANDSLKGRMASTVDEYRAGNYIINEMKKSGMSIVPGLSDFRQGLKLDSQIKKEKYFHFGSTSIMDSTYNILGYIDNKAARTIVLGAHYDHIGMVYVKDSARVIYNGADDNASGVAAVLEIGRLLKTGKYSQYNYIIAAWCGEEVGLVGSSYFCTDVIPKLPLKISAYFNFDMVGRLGWKSNYIEVLGLASSKVWKSLIPKNFEGSDIRTKPAAFNFSDHAGFVKAGIPITYFTTGLPKVYHTPKDEFNLVNTGGVMKIVRLTEMMLSKMDGNDIPFHRFNRWHYLRTGIKSLRK